MGVISVGSLVRFKSEEQKRYRGRRRTDHDVHSFHSYSVATQTRDFPLSGYENRVPF